MHTHFDSNGNLAPFEKLSFELSAVRDFFVTAFPSSSTRQQLFNGLNRYRGDIAREIDGILSQWIGGSFVTQKLDPADIDIANLIQYDIKSEFEIEKLMPFLTIGGSAEKYGVDAHLIPVYPLGDERYENTLLRLKYFNEWFGHDRNGNPKGFIEIKES
ncbi:DUF6932 family protein [Dyadobacter bucti]|jgi:hypothetical protein|uniref:DUF6932 family protein n=1 Tax=Dyadobacter bucti TaxID=2572203 RepID=UPI003F72B7E9